MRFLLKETLTQEDLKKGLNNVLIDGFTSQIMVNLTTGTFLISFALILGASTLIIGILSTIPALCQLSQIFGIFLVERIRKRKLITFSFLLLYRVSLLLIAFMPFFIRSDFAILFFMLFLTFRYLFASIGHTAWSSWMHDLIPKNELGRFFGKRQFISSIFILFTSLIGANFIEFWKNNYVEYETISYSILFFTAFIFGMISLFYIYKVPEPIMNLRENKLKFSKLLLNPLKNKNYKHLLGFLAFWSFGTNLIIPFFVIYLLGTLNFSLTFVVILTIVSQISNLLFLRLWGRLADIYSNKTIFKVCCPLFIICIFLFSLSFIFNNSIFLILLLIITYLLIGISTSGIVLSTGNISLKLTPKGEGASYLAMTTIITSISLGIAPIIGSGLFDFLKKLEYKIDFKQIFLSFNINGVFILCCISIIIGVFSIWFLLQIEEKGDIHSTQFLREFIIEIKNSRSNFSITIGFRDILLFPSLYLTYRALRKKSKRLRNKDK